MQMITRRNLLKTAGFGAIAAALPFRLKGQDPSPTPTTSVKPQPNSAIHRFRIGDWEAVSLGAGIFKMPNPHGLFAPQATPEEFKKALEDECLPTDHVALNLNVLLLRKGKETILVDAGLQGKQPEPFDLLSNLERLGIKASDVTAVFLTHAHFDHMGGMLDKADKLVFPNAEHFCTELERAFWTAEKPDFSMSRADKNGIAGSIAGARRIFDSIKFTQLKDGAKLFDDITAVLASGHTPGHLNLRIESKGERFQHIADMAHHFAVMLPHPDWTVAFDINEPLAAATRKATFARLAAEGATVFGYHLPFPGVGRLKAEGAGYRWKPRLWETGV